MIEFSAWEAANIFCRLAVVGIVLVKLVWFFEDYHWDERFGLGVAGGCALMTVPVLLTGPANPFSEWAGALFAFGVLVYFAGRLRRQINHARRNAEQRRRAGRRVGI